MMRMNRPPTQAKTQHDRMTQPGGMMICKRLIQWGLVALLLMIMGSTSSIPQAVASVIEIGGEELEIDIETTPQALFKEIQRIAGDSTYGFWGVRVSDDWMVFTGNAYESTTYNSTGAVSFFKKDDSGLWTWTQTITFDDIVQAGGFTLVNEGGESTTAANDRYLSGGDIAGNRTIVTSPYAKERYGELGGVAFVFEYNRFLRSWVYMAQLDAGDTDDPGDRFASKVAISGNYAAVGMYNDDVGTCLDDDGNPRVCIDAGSVYIFEFKNNLWQRAAILNAGGDRHVYGRFGFTIDVSDSYTIIGSSSGSTIIRPEYVYVYKNQAFSSATPTPTQKLVTGDSNPNVNFGGWALAIDNDYLAILATGDDDRGYNAGAIYLFKLEGNTWVKTDKIYAPEEGDWGSLPSLALAGDIVVVGDSPPGLGLGGRAFVYYRHGEEWVYRPPLLLPSLGSERYFGSPVAISGSQVMVGSRSATYIYENDASGVIFGRVKDTDGNRLPGVTITSEATIESETVIGTVLTDSNGRYKIENLEIDVPYTISASKGGYNFTPVEAEVELDEVYNGAMVNFTGGSGVPSCSATSDCTITGRITIGDEDGEPLSGVLVENTGTLQSDTTNSQGIYTLDNTAYGEHNLAPSLSGYVFKPALAKVGTIANSTTQDFIAFPIIGPPDDDNTPTPSFVNIDILAPTENAILPLRSNVTAHVQIRDSFGDAVVYPVDMVVTYDGGFTKIVDLNYLYSTPGGYDIYQAQWAPLFSGPASVVARVQAGSISNQDDVNVVIGEPLSDNFTVSLVRPDASASNFDPPKENEAVSVEVKLDNQQNSTTQNIILLLEYYRLQLQNGEWAYGSRLVTSAWVLAGSEATSVFTIDPNTVETFTTSYTPPQVGHYRVVTIAVGAGSTPPTSTSTGTTSVPSENDSE